MIGYLTHGNNQDQKAYTYLSQESDPLIEFYKIRLKYFYGASVETVDWSRIEEAIREKLNEEVREQTEEKIEHIVEGEVNSLLKPAPPLSVVTGNLFKVNKGHCKCITTNMQFIHRGNFQHLAKDPL